MTIRSCLAPKLRSYTFVCNAITTPFASVVVRRRETHHRHAPHHKSLFASRAVSPFCSAVKTLNIVLIDSCCICKPKTPNATLFHFQRKKEQLSLTRLYRYCRSLVHTKGDQTFRGPLLERKQQATASNKKSITMVLISSPTWVGAHPHHRGMDPITLTHKSDADELAEHQQHQQHQHQHRRPQESLSDASSWWVCPASDKSVRTSNPIRAIVDPIVANVKLGCQREDGKDPISLAVSVTLW